MTKGSPASDVPAQMRRQEFLRVIRSIARESVWPIEEAFQRLACSCAPQREELVRLEEERKKRLDAAAKKINEALGVRIEELRRQIAQIDYVEHPKLDKIAQRASRFFALWMIECIATGEVDLLDEASDVRATRFAEAWLGGWRPSLSGQPA